MKVLVTGAAGFIGFHTSPVTCLSGAMRSSASTISTTTTTSRSRKPGSRELAGHDGFRVRAAPISPTGRHGGSVRSKEQFETVIHLAAQAGVRYSLDQSARLRRQQPRRLREHPRRLPASRRRASGLRVVELGLRRQHEDAVLGAPQRRPSGQPLRGDEEGQRADGAHATAICSACRRPACGSSPSTARGAGRTWRCSCSRGRSWRASRSTSSTTASMRARLHLHRRHRRRRRARARPRPARRIPSWSGDTPDPGTSTRPTGSTTSAITSRSN